MNKAETWKVVIRHDGACVLCGATQPCQKQLKLLNRLLFFHHMNDQQRDIIVADQAIIPKLPN